MGMHSLGIKPAADGRLNISKDQLRWLNQVMIENGSPKFICGDRFLLPDVQFAAFLTWAFERNYNKDDFIKGLSWVEDYYHRISTRPLLNRLQKIQNGLLWRRGEANIAVNCKDYVCIT